MDNEKYWYAASKDQELWTASDLDEAVGEAVQGSTEELKKGDIITIYRGESKGYRASEFAPQLFEMMHESAYDANELAEDWDADEEKLQAEFKVWIDKWFEDNNCQPAFETLKNIIEIKVEISEVDEYGCGYKILDNKGECNLPCDEFFDKIL